MIVEETLCLDPFFDLLFVFTNKQRNKIKILARDKTGFILWLKALDRDRFKWPLKHESVVISLTGEQLNWLLDGIDVFAMKPHKTLFDYHLDSANFNRRSGIGGVDKLAKASRPIILFKL